MARQKQSKAAVVLEFFRTAPLEVAETVYGLVVAEMRARRPTKTVKQGKVKPIVKVLAAACAAVSESGNQ